MKYILRHTQNNHHHVDKKQQALPFLQYICEKPKWHGRSAENKITKQKKQLNLLGEKT